MGLRGLYQEAVAQDDAALNRVLREYDEVLADSPGNAVRRRETCRVQDQMLKDLASSKAPHSTAQDAITAQRCH